MIKIEINEALVKKHQENIRKKILKNIKKARKKFFLFKETALCLEYLDNSREIENILVITPNQMRVYMDFFKKEFPSSLREEKELNKVLREEIFEKEYENWGGRKKEYNAYEFVQTLDLKSCPYCNRNYTFTVVNKDGKMRPQIDHFYPKSKYPFLAMSFFNLIPSCPSCNHIKSDKLEENLINPYEIEENNLKFTYTPKSIDFANVEREKYNFDSFEIEVLGNEANRKTFKLDELYKQHKDIVLELLIKKAYYPESYIKELSSFGFNKEEIYRYLMCNYTQDKDLHKRPLSKLIKDISEELDLY